MFVDDSQSEGSGLSEPVDDEEGDGSSLGDAGGAQRGSGDAAQEEPEAAASGSRQKKARKPRKKASKKSKESTETPQPQPQTSFKATTDTDAMMNGLKISDQDEAQEETIHFESAGQNGSATAAPTATNGHNVTPAERQRREHEDYKKKRDSDPAFIPNRGNFFMHDTRGQPNGQAPPPRGVWQAKGRGRGGANVGGPFSPANQMAQAERAAEQPWKHDLHDAINEEPQAPTQPAAPFRPAGTSQDQNYSARLFPKPPAPRSQGGHRVLSFDITTLSGKVRVRVSLPGMKAPVNFSDVPVNTYVRLPDHRPPLRRDKPVRVSLPESIQRYIFPTTDRSFIFIPRQMRPNQQGFHRGHYQRSIGGYGYSSRRTSMYGGSIYSPSVAASRRSSMAGISRDNAFSPVGSFVGMPPSRPVVRLPHGVQHYSATSTPIGPLSGQHTPTSMPQQMHTYPLPQQPQFQGTPTTTVHQPRPQKAISVTGIESPAMVQQASAEPQPFQNQLPAHMNEQPAYPQQPPPPYFSPRQQYQYPQPQPQPQTGTPLSGIPEQAIHAPSFQPPAYGQPPFYGPYPPQQTYYYSPPGPNVYPQMPVYMVPPPPPQGYMVPPPGPPMVPQQPPPQQQSSGEQQPQQQPSEQQQSGMVAHESNGMVFYVPASEAQQSENYQPAEGFVPSYAMPGLPPPTPAPDHQMGYYYPPMPQSGMQEVGTAVYYPASQ